MLNQASNAAILGAGASYAAATPPRPPRPLDRIGIEADRVNQLTYLVREFLDRFHGASPVQSEQMAGAAIQVSYHSEIDRLSANVDALTSAVQVLGETG